MKALLALAVVVTSSCSLLAQEHDVLFDEVPYSEVGGQKHVGYFARPTVKGELPAVILIHEWWGLNDDIRAKARKFASLGYVALAVDLYGGRSTTDPGEARKLAGEVRSNMDAAQQNLADAIAALKKSPHVDDGRLASIGWCFGGGWSYQIAKNNLGVKASVIYYGAFNPEDDLAQMRASIIGHFAEEDRAIRIDGVKEFQAKLKTLSGNHEIYIYPNTTHGFASREGENPNYSSDEAKLAWTRTLEFLEKHVVEDSAASNASNVPQGIPKELNGLSGMILGKLVSKDIEKGELVIQVDYIPRVWRNNKAPKPRAAIGKTFTVDNITGKWLDALLLMKPGETLQLEVNHQRGDRLRFPGELLEKTAPFDAEKFPIPPDGFRGFRGVVEGSVVNKVENSRELTLKVANVDALPDGNQAKNPESAIGKNITVAGFWVGALRKPFDDMNPGDRIKVGLKHNVKQSDHFSVTEAAQILDDEDTSR